MDPAITEKGIEQCKLAREKIKELNVKLVIVSPLKRVNNYKFIISYI